MKSYKISDAFGANKSSYLSRSRTHEGASRDENTTFSKDICKGTKIDCAGVKHLNEKYPRPKELEAFCQSPYPSSP